MKPIGESVSMSAQSRSGKLPENWLYITGSR